jgi:hypothetical protein
MKNQKQEKENKKKREKRGMLLSQKTYTLRQLGCPLEQRVNHLVDALKGLKRGLVDFLQRKKEKEKKEERKKNKNWRNGITSVMSPYIFLGIIKHHQASCTLVKNTVELFVQDHLREPKGYFKKRNENEESKKKKKKVRVSLGLNGANGEVNEVGNMGDLDNGERLNDL